MRKREETKLSMKKGVWKSFASLTRSGKAKLRGDEKLKRGDEQSKGKEGEEKSKSKEKDAVNSNQPPTIDGKKDTPPSCSGSTTSRRTRCASMENVPMITGVGVVTHSDAFFTDVHAFPVEEAQALGEWKPVTPSDSRRKRSMSADFTFLKGFIYLFTYLTLNDNKSRIWMAKDPGS